VLVQVTFSSVVTSRFTISADTLLALLIPSEDMRAGYCDPFNTTESSIWPISSFLCPFVLQTSGSMYNLDQPRYNTMFAKSYDNDVLGYRVVFI
jgi:hypothetical protein